MIRRPVRPREGGVILLLTLFVILITYALVAQLTIGTSVSYRVAENSADRIRMTRAATDVSAEELLRMLADDMPGGAEDEAVAGADGLVSGLGGQGDPGEGGEEEDDGSNSDSRNDDWWRPTRFPIGEMEVHGFVQDENSKFNILSVFHPDQEVREQNRERFVRILDFLREDFEDDLDTRESERILEEFIEWCEGDLRDLEYPLPQRHSTLLLAQLASEAELASRPGNDTESGGGDAEQATGLTQELYLPYSLEEMLLLESVTEEVFYDEVRTRDRIAPGIETVFTIYTTINFDPPSADELNEVGDGSANDLSDVGAGADVQDSGEDESETDEGSSLTAPVGGLDDILEAPAAIGELINVNTAHPSVIKGMLRTDQFPSFFVEQILRYRNEVDEETLAEQEGEDRDFNLVELQRAIFREDEKVPTRYFRNLEDLTNIEGWEDRLEAEQREAFEALIGVQSDIFSVYLWCRLPDEGWEQENHYEEPPGPVLRLKAVVWRRQGEDGAKFVFIEPWHEVSRTRWRIPDFQDELGAYFPPDY
ncbi:MAG: type II secretion system protein GspK [Planctomycetes bacterium]|nr:type II secretion system protein GspK [Planctomycetota bacterium]